MGAQIKRIVLASVIVVLLAAGSGALAMRAGSPVVPTTPPIAGGCPGIPGPC